MVKNYDSQGSAGYRLSADPWGQAALVSALTLIPARKYPAWLKRALVWGPTAGVVAIIATPGAPTSELRKLRTWQGQDPAAVQLPEITPMARTALAIGAGAAMYASWRLSFWSDTAAENVVRKLRIPAPRVAMALTAGAATWWQVTRDNRRRAGQLT
ncbi:hypothetical protein [Nesterenkonia haasae]|uniref:hypothetical protein n=1 Tax=Nesterenkonia haasae TaxID=2587813 RepID=UPI001391942E|nr:hypothetical protein [Nesterenkonia haasae]NDK32350.1 hypothetical protein [Nesterenkonia haasae]